MCGGNRRKPNYQNYRICDGVWRFRFFDKMKKI